jgi:MFS family permease
VALPSIRTDLGFSTTSLQWVVNAYTVLFAGFLLLGGRAADLLPRRAVFIWGFILFSGASLVCGLAPNALTLTLARCSPGAGGRRSRAGHAVRPDERKRALGAWGAAAGGGGAAGVLLGGLVTALLDWRWVFLINVPIGLIAILLARRVVRPDHRGHQDGSKLDIAGAATASAGLVALVYGIVTTHDHDWGIPAHLGAHGGRRGVPRLVPGDPTPFRA